ncbi:Omp28-related outer membrane protein [Vicingaceae bacterium]|nr:Omp28-related outer membrane protein [Vicingaceae bacterium]MDB4061277.1 Omp28-related outer membrane protein [Vicingaceae bacterium]MDC0004778.1 Omp28-related outer membrane protein [bacterium]MDC1451891.1 Omp28-related outer membrane protein [Vicingaceae bacterium]
MKKILLVLSIALGAMTFTSCQQETALTPNPEFIPNADVSDPNSGGAAGGGGSAATFLASTDLLNRAALLEDFTGVRCGFCPDGHVRATAAQAELGADKFVIMAVHTGSYAAPAAGWANFTTPYGTAIDAQADVSGYPAGTINRLPASSLGVTAQRGGTAMSRGSWKTAAIAVNALEAPVNIGAEATIDGNNLLTVKVDLYYTQGESAVNNINVALLQDGLVSKQSGGTPRETYVQNHVLRDLITGQWGEPITETTNATSKISKTFTYTVPADYNGTAVEGGGAVVIGDLKVVVFVTRGRVDVLNAIEVDIK